jgi:phosphoglycolate phosphatase-like HAD superfamily hydrolase
MANRKPNVLALDFDGVICDGLVEYFQTTWKAYLQIWQPVEQTPPAGLAERFYPLRPVIETGWEMPLLVRALLAGIPEAQILQDWPGIVRDRLQAENLDAAHLSNVVDGVRDAWITSDLEGWLSLHRFYPGVLDRLRQVLQSDITTRIISTKEGRFIRRLLARENVSIADDQILGKEVKQPKAETLRDLTQQFQQHHSRRPIIWFVEDRLKTLGSIASQPDLSHVQLFLADWGYNTASDRAQAQGDPAIHLISLEQFVRDFSSWR